LGAHSTRKTYAWRLFLETGSVDIVQAVLQHAFQSTTLQYLKGGFEHAVEQGFLIFGEEEVAT
jgi:integrase